MPETLDAQAQAESDRALRNGLGDVGRAFFNFPALSPVQRVSIPPIQAGSNVLVCAATAAGKTEAVLAPLIFRARNADNFPGIRVLAIAPTRALVADLTARLEPLLAPLSWRVAAQTSDFAGATGEPEVLITTPESLDSMLVRRARRDADGKVSGHLLAAVTAVFVDEAHLFDATARGDQVIFLLERLRRLRTHAMNKGWPVPDMPFQVCAASATVPEPHELALRLLGSNAETIICPGARELLVMTTSGSWHTITAVDEVTKLRDKLPVIHGEADVAEQLWSCLADGSCRKALVFVNARSHCDELAQSLRQSLRRQRELWVGGHHGSLSREERLRAESSFQNQADAVLVSTSTLEVGVDIGSVDLVVLVGPPPDVPALLQRIGRGGRRTDKTRVLALARSFGESAIFASELISARLGCLEPRPRFRRWDIFPQQVISFLRQNGTRGRVPKDFVDLACAVWPHANTFELVQSALMHWQNEKKLTETQGRFSLDGEWERYATEGDDAESIHSNISSTGGGLVVRDNLTGNALVEVSAVEGQTLVIAGRGHRVERHDEGLVVVPLSPQEEDHIHAAPNYGGRRRPVSFIFASHLRAGCGLAERTTPLLLASNGRVWFHFGGEFRERMLRDLFPSLFQRTALRGLALLCSGEPSMQLLNETPISTVRDWIKRQGVKSLTETNLGPFSSCLHEEIIHAMTEDSALISSLHEWLRTMIVQTTLSDGASKGLNQLLEC